MQIASSEWVLGDRSRALARTAAAGLTAIELDARPDLDSATVRRSLDQHCLTAPSLCWQWNPDAELGSPDRASRSAAQRYLRGALEQAAELGSGQLVVVPACRETPWQDEPRQAGIERAAAAIREVLVDAPAQVGLSIEALSTDESFLLGATSSALDAANGNAAPTTDVAGNARVDLAGIANSGTGTPAFADIGAYERQP